MRISELFRRLWRREPARPEPGQVRPYHIMLDLETLGLAPGCTVLRIGAARFTLTEGVIDTFDCGVTKWSCDEAGLVAEDSAIAFWERQGPEAIAHLTKEPLYDLTEALLRFNSWISGYEKGYLLGIWGNGAAFDQPIINAAYRAIDFAPAWTYKQEMCYRTVKELNRDVPYPTFEGVEHNALDDARAQVEHMLRIYRQKGHL